MDCNFLHQLAAKHVDCEVTERGLRFTTHCYYPSFDRVAVYVSRFGEGFRLSDGGDAARSAFIHGRDDQAFEISLKKACVRFGVEPHEGALVAQVDSEEWLFAAILAVANGAAQAASETSSKVSARKTRELRLKIHAALSDVVPAHTIATEYTYPGRSGHNWKIDYAILKNQSPLLVKAISPDVNSINSNYTTFDDIFEAEENYTRRFSVFEQKLKHEDQSLMLRVAELVPLASLEIGARAALSH